MAPTRVEIRLSDPSNAEAWGIAIVMTLGIIVLFLILAAAFHTAWERYDTGGVAALIGCFVLFAIMTWAVKEMLFG